MNEWLEQFFPMTIFWCAFCYLVTLSALLVDELLFKYAHLDDSDRQRSPFCVRFFSRRRFFSDVVCHTRLLPQHILRINQFRLIDNSACQMKIRPFTEWPLIESREINADRNQVNTINDDPRRNSVGEDDVSMPIASEKKRGRERESGARVLSAFVSSSLSLSLIREHWENLLLSSHRTLVC